MRFFENERALSARKSSATSRKPTLILLSKQDQSNPLKMKKVKAKKFSEIRESSETLYEPNHHGFNNYFDTLVLIKIDIKKNEENSHFQTKTI